RFLADVVFARDGIVVSERMHDEPVRCVGIKPHPQAAILGRVTGAWRFDLVAVDDLATKSAREGSQVCADRCHKPRPLIARRTAVLPVAVRKVQPQNGTASLGSPPRLSFASPTGASSQPSISK